MPILPWVGTALAVLYAIKVTYNIKSPCVGSSSRINEKIDKSNPKVATMVDIEDLGEKTAFCRCWKSEKVYERFGRCVILSLSFLTIFILFSSRTVMGPMENII